MNDLERVRRAVEEAFRKSEERLRFVLDRAHVGYWDWDFERRHLEWSASCKRMFGFAADEPVTYQRFMAAVHPEDRDQLVHGLQACIGGCGEYDAQFRTVRSDGSTRWLHVKGDSTFVEGRVTRIAGIALDVTERQRIQEEQRAAAEALRQRGMQFETLLNAAPIGVYLVDADFRFRSVNPVALPAFGGLPDLIGRDFGEILRRLLEPADAEQVIGIVRHTLESGTPYVAAEYEVRRADRGGMADFYEWRTHRIPLPDGRFGVVSYFRDIAEQRAARTRVVASEECARRAQAEAEAANRAKDDFLATVSHELRAPLQGILGWLALLKRGQLDATQAAHALDSVERSVRLQAQLVRDIMDSSRIAAGMLTLERAPLDVAMLVRSTAEEFTPGAVAKNIKLVVETQGSQLVTGDRERLHQVLGNLLGNAIKFTPPGGRITCSARHEGNEIILEVADTGEGIDANFLPRLFYRFTQSDGSSTRQHGGLGLGLSIVRHLVELHGGTVTAESAGRGRGATFRISLPAALPATAASAALQPPMPEPVPRLDGVEILLVEDDRDTLDAMTMALEAMGARVMAAASAGEAFSAFREHVPDLLVSDLGMPHEDGYSLLRRIREERAQRAVPAIALTGYTRAEDRERALAAGFAAHVPKPVDPDRFVRLLADLLREQRVATS